MLARQCHLFNKKISYKNLRLFLFLSILILFCIVVSIAKWLLRLEDPPFPAYFKLLSPDGKNFPDSNGKVYSKVEFLCDPRRIVDSKKIDNFLENNRTTCYRDNNGKTIHFVQLTPWTDLDSCAIVTAAANNPNYQVCVLQPEKILLTANTTIRKKFSRYPNIRLDILDVEKLFENTVLLNWYIKSCESLSEQKIFVAQLADCVRWAYLFKYGGVSLDTDAFTLKSFENLSSNIVAWQNEGILNNAVLVFDKNNDFVAEIINTLPNYAKIDKWGSTSYWLMTDVYKERRSRFKITGDAETWVRVGARSIFYPFYWGAGPESSPFLASSFDQVARDTRNSYTIHLFRGKYTSYWMGTKKIDEQSFIGKLVRKYCSF